MSQKIIRCAIYTRKSTDEGLEKEFNTLDAQREAGEAYIKSQMHEGWRVIPTQYDDGGFSGGNMDRPALQQLMADIRARKVNVIVVYKVDRLTRSLADFAKIVEMLDEHDVSFVSVTQQFNTSTSMGRLTLNVLLSFAQFEREVISERVRDKIAASKKKGMWIGGPGRLGYDVEHRKLVINPEEAEIVRHMYELYLTHQSAIEVTKRLNAKGLLNKRWFTKDGREKGGKPFSKTAVYRMLNDPLYIGKIEHKGQIYEGEHKAIIDQELWDATRAMFEKQSVHRTKLRTESGTILRGKCVDGEGRAYTTTYSVRHKHSHFRYYINKHINHRIRGDKLEKLVFDAIHYICLRPEYLQQCFTSEYALLSEEEGLYRLQNLFSYCDELTEKEKHRIAQQIIEKVTILPESTTVRVNYTGLNQILKEWSPISNTKNDKPNITQQPTVTVYDDSLEITVSVIFKKRGKTSQAYSKDGKAFNMFKTANHNMTLINALAKAYKWNYLIAEGEKTITAIANENGLSRTYVSKMLNLNFLAPDIVETILKGKQPEGLRLKDLMKPMPLDWKKQNLKITNHQSRHL